MWMSSSDGTAVLTIFSHLLSKNNRFRFCRWRFNCYYHFTNIYLLCIVYLSESFNNGFLLYILFGNFVPVMGNVLTSQWRLRFLQAILFTPSRGVKRTVCILHLRPAAGFLSSLKAKGSSWTSNPIHTQNSFRRRNLELTLKTCADKALRWQMKACFAGRWLLQTCHSFPILLFCEA